MRGLVASRDVKAGEDLVKYSMDFPITIATIEAIPALAPALSRNSHFYHFTLTDAVAAARDAGANWQEVETCAIQLGMLYLLTLKDEDNPKWGYTNEVREERTL